MLLVPRAVLDVLVKEGVIDREKAEKIEVDSVKNDIPIDKYLFQKTDIKKSCILNAIGTVLNLPTVDISNVAIDPQALSYISESIARKYHILPYIYNAHENKLFIATANPHDFSLLDFLEKKTANKIVFVMADLNDIIKVIDIAFSQSISPDVKEALREVTPEEKTSSTSIGTVVKEAPIAKIVNTILEFSVKSRASDIHIEPEENRTKVRYRIDGILQEKLNLPKVIHEAVVSRIKIMSEMKIDEKRIPQDGRFTFTLGEEIVDLRVSTLPTVHGEKIVMRLLKKTGGLPSLNELGLRGPHLKDLEEAIAKPYGIILVTGPTGSGKTTTLYSVLSRLNKPSVNIVTLEDPVEYQIVGINQVQINPQAGLTFANGLRAFLRQDPNIILVGEIRDTETTQLAIQAALTGHLVFSTLHTNDSSTSIPRLIDLGGEPFLIASVLNASLAQRIVRRICTFCKQEYEPAAEVQENIKQVLGDLLPRQNGQNTPIKLYKGKGCEHCDNTGYLGRIGIYELLKISSTINKMILKQATAKEIEAQAKTEGMIIMKQDGYLKTLEGITTIEEVLRVAEV